MTQITILGCGVTGMLAALRFAHEGIPTTIIECSDMKWIGDRRTIALTSHSKDILNKISLWGELEPYIGEVKDIYVVDNKSPQMLHWLQDNGSAVGYMIENRDLRDVILSAVKKNPLITLFLETEYDELTDKSDLVILSTGKGSKLRERYFKDKISKSYDQSAMTFLVHHEKSHEGTAVEHFMPQGPFASLPMRNVHESGIVWTEKSSVAELYMSMPEEKYLYYFKQRFGDFLGDVRIVSSPAMYPLSARITKNYYYDKMVVVGDAAHTIHPLAGQGLNQGIKDIDVLGEVIARNILVGLGVTELALKDYQNRRKLDNYMMFLFTDNMNRLFSNDLPVLREVRRLGLGLLDQLPILKNKFMGYTGV